jgi:hypothetical protein
VQVLARLDATGPKKQNGPDFLGAGRHRNLSGDLRGRSRPPARETGGHVALIERPLLHRHAYARDHNRDW